MKYIITLLILIAVQHNFAQDRVSYQILNKSAQQNTFKREPKRFVGLGVGYQLSLPNGHMKHGLQSAHSIAINGLMPLNFISKNLLAGVDLGFGLYGWNEFGINYRLGNNYVNTSITYNSSVARAAAQFQYIFNRNKLLQPFVTAQLGYMELWSSFSVNDPRDPEACRALESDVLYASGNTYVSYGAGLNWRISKNSSDFLQLKISHTRGGNVDYINVGKLHQHSQPINTSTDAKPVYVQFVNPTNQEVHKHQIAELFSSSINFLEAKISFVTYLKLR